jgi:hypothetical protein
MSYEWYSIIIIIVVIIIIIPPMSSISGQSSSNPLDGEKTRSATTHLRNSMTSGGMVAVTLNAV